MRNSTGFPCAASCWKAASPIKSVPQTFKEPSGDASITEEGTSPQVLAPSIEYCHL